MAQSFNVSDASIKGEAFPLIEEILVNRSFGRAAFSASANGVLASRSSDFTANRLVWFDRSGNRLESFEKDNAAEPRLSPDEKQIALSEGGDIWILDLERGFSTGFTYDQAADDFPVWSPDGATIVFASDRDGGSNLYQKPASGAGEPELLFEGCAAPTSWSLDGRFLLCSTTQTGPDLIILPLFGTREPIPFRQTESWEFWGQFSPDGEWIRVWLERIGFDANLFAAFPRNGNRRPMASLHGWRWLSDVEAGRKGTLLSHGSKSHGSECRAGPNS